MTRSRLYDALLNCLTALVAAPFAIIALAFAAVPVWQAYRYHLIKWQVEKRLPDLDPLILALDLYHRQHGCYPVSLYDLPLAVVPSLPQPPFRGWDRDRGYSYGRYVEKPYDPQRLIDETHAYQMAHGRNPAALSQLPPYFPEADGRGALPRPGPRINPHPGRPQDTYRLTAWIVRKHDAWSGWMEWLSYSPDGYRPEAGDTKPYARIGRWNYCTDWD